MWSQAPHCREKGPVAVLWFLNWILFTISILALKGWRDNSGSWVICKTTEFTYKNMTAWPIIYPFGKLQSHCVKPVASGLFIEMSHFTRAKDLARGTPTYFWYEETQAHRGQLVRDDSSSWLSWFWNPGYLLPSVPFSQFRLYRRAVVLETEEAQVTLRAY